MVNKLYLISTVLGISKAQFHTDDRVEHVIGFSSDITDNEKTVLRNLYTESIVNANRGFSDFVRMSFWAAILQHQANGHSFNDIHEISTEQATNWFIDEFVDYGCYCWPQRDEDGLEVDATMDSTFQQKIHGFGSPVDERDHLCHDLYQCYRCTSMQPGCQDIDWVHSHYDCNFIRDDDGILSLECTDPNVCMQSLCECDKAFALGAFRAVNQTAHTENNLSIFPQQCERKGHITEDKTCCGSWPAVRPFEKESNCCDSNNDLHTFEQLTRDGLNKNSLGGQCSNYDLDSTFETMFDERSGLTMNSMNPNLANHNHADANQHGSSTHTHRRRRAAGEPATFDALRSRANQVMNMLAQAKRAAIFD